MGLADVKRRKTLAAMKCPFCESRRTGVTDTRPTGNYVRRVRICIDCDERFTTYEALKSVAPEVGHPDRRQYVRNADLLDRWIRVFKIEDMGVRAVKETA